MAKRTENVMLLKIIGVCELIAAVVMYIYSPPMVGIIGGLILVGLAANSFYQAHKCYRREYSPKKKEFPGKK